MIRVFILLTLFLAVQRVSPNTAAINDFGDAPAYEGVLS